MSVQFFFMTNQRKLRDILFDVLRASTAFKKWISDKAIVEFFHLNVTNYTGPCTTTLVNMILRNVSSIENGCYTLHIDKATRSIM